MDKTNKLRLKILFLKLLPLLLILLKGISGVGADTDGDPIPEWAG